MKRIVIPIDGSKNSLATVQLLEKLGMLTNNKYYLLNVQNLTLLYENYSSLKDEKDILPFLTHKGLHELKEVEALFQGKDYKTVVKLGEPVREIINFAQKKNADFIVMGSRGASGLSAVLMGSIASKVLAYSPIPVIIARNWQTPADFTLKDQNLTVD